MPMITARFNGVEKTVDTGGMTPQQYMDYYNSHGIRAELVRTGAPGQFDQLMAFGQGQGAAPKGLVSALTSTGPNPSMSQPDPESRGIRVLMPDQSTKQFSIDDPALDAALQAGARPIELDGGIMTDLKKFNGGWVVRRGEGYVPLNVLAGGDWLPGQKEALEAGGLGVGATNTEYQGTPYPGEGGNPPQGGPGAGPIPGSGGGTPPGGGPGGPLGYANNGWMGNQNAQAPALSKDLEDALRELMQEARTQGVRGQEALTGLVDDYKNYLGFARAGAEQTFQRRNELVNRILGLPDDPTAGVQQGGLESALTSAYNTMNQATGLSPEAMQALRMNAIEGPERAYQGQVEGLKTALAQRGAYGGGALPGDAGAMIRGYAPLMQGRDATRSNLLANTILADEQRKFDTLGLNRQTALGAMGTGAGLATGMANAFNPSSLFGANEGALSGLGNTLAQRTGAGFQGIDSAGQFASMLNQSDPNSWANLLKASLLSTGANAVANNADKIGGWIKRAGQWVWDNTIGRGNDAERAKVFGDPYKKPNFDIPGMTDWNPFD